MSISAADCSGHACATEGKAQRAFASSSCVGGVLGNAYVAQSGNTKRRATPHSRGTCIDPLLTISRSAHRHDAPRMSQGDAEKRGDDDQRCDDRRVQHRLSGWPAHRSTTAGKVRNAQRRPLRGARGPSSIMRKLDRLQPLPLPTDEVPSVLIKRHVGLPWLLRLATRKTLDGKGCMVWKKESGDASGNGASSPDLTGTNSTPMNTARTNNLLSLIAS